MYLSEGGISGDPIPRFKTFLPVLLSTSFNFLPSFENIYSGKLSNRFEYFIKFFDKLISFGQLEDRA